MKSLLRGVKWPGFAGILLVLLTASLSAQTTLVYVTDEAGRVGTYNTGTTAATPLGSLTGSGFTPSQVIGLAYDSNTNAILLFDRSANTVYSMNATTGVASVLFTTSGVSFQGGAVFGGLIYGINENTQKLAAYSFSGVDQNLTGAEFSDHVHALGVDYDHNRLISMTNTSGVRVINTDGTEGSILLNSSQTNSLNSEDVAYFNGNYLVASYEREVYQLDGTTGAKTTLLTDAQLTAMGITGSVSGVTINFEAVPEPATWALLLIGVSALFLARRRVRRRA